MIPGLGALAKALRWLGLAYLGAGAPFTLSEALREAPRTTTERPALARPTPPSRIVLAPRSAPSTLVDALRGDPFGADCPVVTDAYWPFEARRCTYAIADRSYDVVTATPTAERVAAWIVDASAMIPSLAALETTDPRAFERGVGVVARYTMNQSGRSFPLDGVVFEDFEGANEYEFRGGVTFGITNEKTRSCGDCACRPNSLHRDAWCTFVADGLAESTPPTTYDACMTSLGGDRGWNDAWASTCVALHADAWERDRSESYRALLHFVEKNQVGPALDGKQPTADDVVAAIEDAFAYPHRRAKPR